MYLEKKTRQLFGKFRRLLLIINFRANQICQGKMNNLKNQKKKKISSRKN